MNQLKFLDKSSIQPQKKCSACSTISLPETTRRTKQESKITFALNSLPYIYALGRIEARFPNRSIEREYSRILEISEITDTANERNFHSVLSQPQRRYLARKLSWVLTRDDVPVYILLPTNPEDLDALLEAIRPSACPLDRSVVIGRKGPVASQNRCGLEVPMVIIDHLFYLEYSKFMKSIQPSSIPNGVFGAAAEDTYRKMMELAGNIGATGKHRALSYLAVRCPAIYTKAEELGRNFLLTSVKAMPSRLYDNRRIMSVVFSFTNRETDAVEKHLVNVDLTEEFPFIVTEI